MRLQGLSTVCSYSRRRFQGQAMLLQVLLNGPPPCFFFGLPLLRLPCGVQRKATLGIESVFMRRTCPSQRQRLIWIVRVNGVIPVLLYRSLFEMVFGQKILRIRRSDLFWKTSSFLSMVAVVFQHSGPYMNTLRTLLLKICILVRILMIVDLRRALA